MRAPVSVIIPVLNAAEVLPHCLAGLGPGLSEGLIREVILSDGGSCDATRALAERAGAGWMSGPAGRGGQLRRGAGAAGGEWLLFLHADTALSPDWPAAVLAHLAGHPGAAGYFRLAFRAGGWPGRRVAGWANWRSRAFGLPFGDQGLLVPRALYDGAGGYPDLPLMEDVAMARRLRGHLRPLDATAETGAERYREAGWLRRGAHNLMLQARYFAGADPAALARRYGR